MPNFTHTPSSDFHQCRYCNLTDMEVESGGFWHCPNPLCPGPGAVWFRLKLSSFKEKGDGKHTVDRREWVEKATAFMDEYLGDANRIEGATVEFLEGIKWLQEAFERCKKEDAPDIMTLRTPVALTAEHHAPVEVRLKVKKCTLLSRAGTDLVSLVLDAPSPFPYEDYDGVLNIEVQKGKGEEWVQKNFNLKPEIIVVGRS